ncbi:MAG: plasmid pRiA4b ORF-3 family protein [Pseudomonadota bacterium]
MQTYYIKIALRGISPMIWRRLRVAGSTSLADLHQIIQIAMGWDDDYVHHIHIHIHIHIHGVDHGIHKSGCNPFRYYPEEVFIDDFEFEVGDRFSYTYNYSEFWVCQFGIEVIDQRTKALPYCLGGSGRKVITTIIRLMK